MVKLGDPNRETLRAESYIHRFFGIRPASRETAGDCSMGKGFTRPTVTRYNTTALR